MKKYWMFAALLVILVAVAYVLFNAKQSAPVSTGDVTQSHAKEFSLTVKDRKVVSGATTLTVQQGDAVSITITANESDELHLHGYDQHIDFATDTPATLTFTADQSGRFPFEMEGSKTDLGEVDVLP
jgi:FtsP/CotA-like multicopper oxidase with cupredoxin domain